MNRRPLPCQGAQGVPYPFPISTFSLLLTRFARYFMDRVFPILGVRILMATIQKLDTFCSALRPMARESIPDYGPSDLHQGGLNNVNVSCPRYCWQYPEASRSFLISSPCEAIMLSRCCSSDQHLYSLSYLACLSPCSSKWPKNSMR